MKFFKKGEKLTKSYIVEKMMGNLEYGKYVPNGVNPHSLSREFLLSVNKYINFYIACIICGSTFIWEISSYRKRTIGE